MLLSPLLAGFPLVRSGIPLRQTALLANPIADGIPLRILPLGASITWGQASSTGNGYRSDLRNLLVAGGNPVNMVGSRQNGDMVDNDVEGWPGYVIEQVYAKAKGKNSVGFWKPNVILVNLGTNDCLQDLDLADAGERMREMVEGLWVLSPRALVVLSSLILNKNETVDERVEAVNKQYAALVSQLKGDGRRIAFVDMHGANGPTLADMNDQTHPNDNGYSKMAKILYAGLVDAGKAKMIEKPEVVNGVPDDGANTGLGNNPFGEE
ncbi:hypothetical protein DL546_005710 [Coniochaeta pulveracea]|uniref:SGNH hydrolase-type esterase domain-containing protein n=1 Tax=Coniochaeta pulveracea TaxID=177199 RepID=A0A420YEC8_9PEZI|nr:hypothetical protein DL546_005710 [Coniochaeta pulveracea]